MNCEICGKPVYADGVASEAAWQHGSEITHAGCKHQQNAGFYREAYDKMLGVLETLRRTLFGGQTAKAGDRWAVPVKLMDDAILQAKKARGDRE